VLFCWENAHPDTITRRFKKLARAAGLPEIDLHDVRHSYGATGGASPLLTNWDGTKWNTIQAPVPSGTQHNQLAAVTALPEGTVWAVGRSDYEDLIINTSNG
jgi:hypothetical protein